MNDIEKDLMNEVIDFGILSDDDIKLLFGENDEENDKNNDSGYRLFRTLYYGALAEIVGLDNISIDPIKNSSFDNIKEPIAIFKFSVAKSVDVDESVVEALNKTAVALNKSYKEYKESFPENLTTEFLNNRDNQIDIWKKLCIYSTDLKSEYSVQYIDDPILGDIREIYKWLCKESDKIITKEDSINAYKKFAKTISETFKEAAKKLKEEEEFKEV